VAGPALTPQLALDYLDELSVDIEAAIVLDSSNRLAAGTGDDDERKERMRELVVELLDRAAAAAPATAGVDQVEVTTPEGSVFAVRGSAWTVGVVAGRKPLSSLMFYDLRNVVSDLGGEAGGGS
jgi:hypothetical protein